MVRIKIWEQGDAVRRLLERILDDSAIAFPTANADITVIDAPIGPGEMLLESGIVLINTDHSLAGLSCHHSQIITYGLDPHATVTPSSVDEADSHMDFCYCLQRSITTLSGDLIDCLDIPVRIHAGGVTVQQGLCAVTVALLCGATPDGRVELCAPREKMVEPRPQM